MDMGIFGSIVGGTIGGMLGGPLGAVLGAVMGSKVSAEAQGFPAGGLGGMGGAGGGLGAQQSQQEMQLVFAVALTSLAAKVAKADGVVSSTEVQAFDGFLKNSLRMSVEDRRVASKVFNEAKESGSSTREFTNQVRQLLGSQPDRMRDIVTILGVVAMADGEFHQSENQIIHQIARELGLSDYEYQSCVATFRSTGQAGGTASPIDPYEVLGVPASASDDEVRSAHRRLVKEYHPDVLRAKGLADDFQEFAKQKMSAINDAWNQVQQLRNL